MNYDFVDALQAINPKAQWTMTGQKYETLNWLESSETKPTEEAINAAEPMRLLRKARDLKLAETDWRASSDLTLSDAWKTYRQSLRDLPASASPKLDSDGNLDMTSVTFPTEPS